MAENPEQAVVETPAAMTPDMEQSFMDQLMERMSSNMREIENAALNVELTGQITKGLAGHKSFTAYLGADRQTQTMEEAAQSGGLDTVSDWLHQLTPDEVFMTSEEGMTSPLSHPALDSEANDKLVEYETRFVNQLSAIGAEGLPTTSGKNLDIFAVDLQEAYKESKTLGKPLFDVMFGDVNWSRASALDKLSLGFNTHLLELQLQGEVVDEERANAEMAKYFPELDYLRTSNNKQFLRLMATKTPAELKQFWNDANFGELEKQLAPDPRAVFNVTPEQAIADRIAAQRGVAMAGEIAVSFTPFVGAAYLMYSAATGTMPVTELISGDHIEIHGAWRAVDVIAALIPAYHGFKSASRAFKAIEKSGGLAPAVKNSYNASTFMYKQNRETLKAALKGIPETQFSEQIASLTGQAETSLSARQLLRLYEDVKADPRNARAIMASAVPSESTISQIARNAVNDVQARQELGNMVLAALKNDAKGSAARKALKAESPEFVNHLIHDVRQFRGTNPKWATRGEQELKELHESVVEVTNLAKADQQRNVAGRAVSFDTYDAMVHDGAVMNPLTGEPIRLALPAPDKLNRATGSAIELGMPENYIGSLNVPVAEGDSILHAGGEMIVHTVDNRNKLITLMDHEGRHYTMSHGRFNATRGDALVYEPEEIRRMTTMQGAPPASKILKWTKEKGGRYVSGSNVIERQGKKWVVLEGETPTGTFLSLTAAKKSLQARVDAGLEAARQEYLLQQANVAALREQAALRQGAVDLELQARRVSDPIDKMAKDAITPAEVTLTPKRPGPKTTKAKDIEKAKKKGKALARKPKAKAEVVETVVEEPVVEAATQSKKRLVKTERKTKLDPEGEAAINVILGDTSRLRSIATYLGEAELLKPKERGMLFATAKRIDQGEQLSAAQLSYAQDILARNMGEIENLRVGPVSLKTSLAAENKPILRKGGIDTGTLDAAQKSFIAKKVKELGVEDAKKLYNDPENNTVHAYARSLMGE